MVTYMKDGATVGHVPHLYQHCACCLFDKKFPTAVTEQQRFPYDLPQDGMEIPCIIRFMGNGKKSWKKRCFFLQKAIILVTIPMMILVTLLSIQLAQFPQARINTGSREKVLCAVTAVQTEKDVLTYAIGHS